MSIIEEKIIVSRAIKGDGEAFTQLYEVHFHKIYRYIYVRLGNKDEAEDLTQEVFAKALEAIGSYQWRSLPFASWLFRIAHNQIIDYSRKQGKMERVDWDDNVAPAHEVDVGVIAEQELELEDLLDKIERLPTAQREVVSLRFGAELSVAEVAKVLGKRPGTVKALQYSGILALRKMLQAEKQI